MAPCNHISLLQIVKGEQVSLVNNERMENLVKEMAWNGSSTVQRPSLQFFIGGEAKNLGLRQIFPQNNFGRGYRDRNSIASLRLDTSTSNSSTPVLFGESNPLVAPGFQYHGIAQCHQTTCQPCCWTSTQSLYDILHARLFFLFADVICIFADDFGNVNNAINRLKVWATIGSASGLSRITRPRVIIVASGNSVSPIHDILEMGEIETNLGSGDSAELQNAFSAIVLLQLAGDCLSPLSRHRRLKESIMRQTDEMQAIRKQMGLSLSAVHLNSLFSKAIRYTAQTITQPFCLIKASREGNELSSEYSGHLQRFFQLGLSQTLTLEPLMSIIASSMLMDFYNPNMHSMSVIND